MKRRLDFRSPHGGESVVASLIKGKDVFQKAGARAHRVWDKECASALPMWLFARDWLRSPRAMGSLCPSGHALAATLAERVPQGDGLVVELGAGTGVVTRALLDRGISLDRLVAVERSVSLAKVLRRRFPALTVVRGNAAMIAALLPRNRVDCVVSSLPLVSMPAEERAAVLTAVKTVLREDGRLIQFSYFGGGERYLAKAGFFGSDSRLVLRNLPPAWVKTFRVADVSVPQPA